MIQVRLETRGSELVADVLIPPMDPPPEAIQLGERTYFQITARVYREGIVLHVADGSLTAQLPPTQPATPAGSRGTRW